MDWGGGGIGVRLVTLLLLLHHFNSVAGDDAWDTIGKAYCVHVGQRPWMHPKVLWKRHYSIGGHRFVPEGVSTLSMYIAHENKKTLYKIIDNSYSWQSSALEKTCKQNAWDFLWSPEGVTRLEVRLNAVQQGGKTLRGWLHVEVEFKDTSDELEWVYVQFLDDQFNAVGEFVSNEEEQCKSSSQWDLIMPNNLQYLPCHAVGYREPKASGAIFVARKEALFDGYPDLVQADIKKGIHVTWRLGEYSCNRHKRIRVETIVFTKKAKEALRGYMKTIGWYSIDDFKALGDDTNMENKCGRLMRKCRGLRHIASHWLVPEQDTWTGTPDIKSGDKELVCTKPAISKDGKVTPEASPWIRSTELNTFKTDFENQRLEKYDSSLDCLEDLRSWLRPEDKPKDPMRTYSGRCGTPNTDFSYPWRVQQCRPPLGSDKKLEKYSDYATNLHTDRLTSCPKDNPCTIPDSSDREKTDDFIKAVNKSAPFKRPAVTEDGQRKISVRFRILVESRKRERWNSLAQTRKYHGNLCILVALFMIPVSNFLARYYKKTFVEKLHRNQPCTPWLVFHLTSWFFVLCFIRSGYTAMRAPIEAWGTSNSGASSFHYYFGYIFIILFTFMGLLGAVRPKEQKMRIAVMMVHSVLGFFLNWASLALVVQSSWIPASPSIDECDKETGETPGFSHVGLIAVLWGVIDLCFHIALTTIQIVLDRREQLKRPGMGVIFPPMYADERRFDFIGAKLRKLLLLIYLGLSITLTLYSMAYLLGKETDEGCTLGNMTCDLEVDHFGCSPIAKKYLTIVNEKYHVEK